MRLKKLTMYVEAYAELSRDAGSIPAASTNIIRTRRTKKLMTGKITPHRLFLFGNTTSVVRLTLLYIWRSLTVSVQPMRSTQRRADFDCDFQYIV